MTEESEGVGLNSPSCTDKIVYWGGHGARWSLTDVMKSKAYQTILTAEHIIFERYGFGKPLHKNDKNGWGPTHRYEGPEARVAAMNELLENGSLGMPTIEEREDGTTYIQANWNFVG